MFYFVKKIFTPPIFDDEDKTRVAFYLNAIVLSTSGLLVLLLIIRLIQGTEPVLSPANIILVAMIGLLLGARYLMKKGHVQLASHLLVGLAWAGLTYLALDADGIRDSTFIAFFVVIIMSSLLIGTRAMIFYTVISILTGFGLAYLDTFGTIQFRMDTSLNFARDVAFIFALVGMFLYLLTSSLNNALTQARTSARKFQSGNIELQALQSDLEKRVEERTAELDAANREAQRRAAQLEAIAQVTRSISTSQDVETLLPNITNVISQQFGFYHVGIFLLNREGDFAVLRAANSPGGKKMLARNHKLKVGETGIVGFVTGHGRARIALDTGADAIYFNNPELPETRSELALPLIIGSQVIGALDVQSVEPNAFSQEDVNTLTILADQVSVAIQNSILYEETRKALAESQATIKQFTQEGWMQFTKTTQFTGIRHSKERTTLLKEPLPKDDLIRDGTLDLPINLRSQKIGVLKLRASATHQWTQDEIEIASAIVERAAIALENARLLSEAQQRASRERIIGDISASISTFSDMEGILRTAVQQLGRRLGGAEVVLELGTDLEKD